MLELKEITMDLRERYKKLTRDNKMSYYSFTNIYMSRNCTYFKYVEIEGGVCMISQPPQANPMCMFPLGVENLRSALETIRDGLGKISLIPLTQEMVRRLEKECPGMFTFQEVRNSFDYVYETQKLIELKGKAYHSKRNHISRFTMQNQYEFIPLDQSNVKICVPIMNKWFEEHPGLESPVFNEKMAILELINHFDELEMKGGAILVGGEIRAFSFGEYLQPNIAHILIEKADISYPELYAVINHEFLQHQWADTEFVNREEDMGLEGLRKAKLSYHQACFNKVYIAKWK